MRSSKRLLTFGVTVNPTFKIRNLIRDSLSAIAQSDLSYNPAENVAKGWKATSKNSQPYASMLASGGIIKFGTQEDTNRVRAQIEKLGGQVLDKSGVERFKGQMKSFWEVYEEFGDRTENVNRAALYERLIAKGHSHAEASFMARDLMDFSMSGKWETVRFLAQTVPFLNARLQGLYKLGRAAKEDPRRFVAMAGAVSLASLGLLAAYGDDDDWKKREDWDRDNFWWFKVGDKAFRIPKPFEVGAIGTLAERTAELMLSDEMTGKRFGQRISDPTATMPASVSRSLPFGWASLSKTSMSHACRWSMATKLICWVEPATRSGFEMFMCAPVFPTVPWRRSCVVDADPSSAGPTYRKNVASPDATTGRAP